METEERQRTWDQGHNHHYYHHKLYTLNYVPAQQFKGAALAPSVLIERTLVIDERAKRESPTLIM